jgi:hypothetical protein
MLQRSDVLVRGVRAGAGAGVLVIAAMCMTTGSASARLARSDELTQQTTTGALGADPKPAGKPEPQPGAGNGPEKTATSVNVITGLGTASSDHYKPLVGRDRWEFYVHQNFTTAGAYFGPVTSSVVDQIEGQPPEWGGGMAGYGKRVASRLGTTIIQGSVQSAGCALLGHDPRYIRSADRRILHRIGHAFLFTLVTYNEEGNVRPAVATLGAYYTSSMVSTLWYPDRFTVFGDGVRDGNRQVIGASVMNQVQEFWPEIVRYVFRRK